MMISNVRGESRTIRGDFKLNESDITQSEIDIEIDTSYIHTGDEQRDVHLRSPDFLDAVRHPLLTARYQRSVGQRPNERPQRAPSSAEKISH